jgi:glycosyltransferase involved in cell wall biosynthesis
MKIVHIVPGPLYRGGVGTLVSNLCVSLAGQGNSVTTYYVDKTAVQQDKTRNVHGVFVRGYKPIIGDPLYAPSQSLLKDLEREKPDIIHMHNIHTLLPACIAMFRKHLMGKMVLQTHYHEHGQSTARSALFSTYKKVLTTIVLQRFDAFIANSEYEKTSLERDFPSISSRIILIPEEYSLTFPAHLQWKPATQTRRLLFVGALTKYKNVDKLIRALKILNLKRKDVELIIIGDGPEKQRLMELGLELDIYDKITWKHGLSYNELWQEYATASAVVLLSTLESFSRVAHEAIAVGMPLIVYNYGPLSALVKKGFAKGAGSLDPKAVASVANAVLNMEWKNINERPSLNRRVYADLVIKLYKSLVK